MPTLAGTVAAKPWTATLGGLILSPGSQTDLWPLPINWRQEWVESYEFKTEVITSEDQHEQRRALRKNPRVLYEFLTTLYDTAAAQQARRRLAAREAKQWVIPHARYATRLMADVPAGTTGFSLDSDPSWAEVGREVVFRRRTDAELGTIATYSAGSGTLSQPVLRLIPAGTPVHLGVRGRLEASTRAAFATTTAGELQVQLLAEPGGHYVPPAGAAGETYNGKEVWTRKPNWGRAPSIEYQQAQHVIDIGFGVRGYADPVDYVSRTYQTEMQIKTQTQFDEVCGFFLRHYGKRVDFYMPAWTKELVPSSIATDRMTFSDNELSSLMGVDPSHRHIAIYLKDGTKLFRGVSTFASTVNGSVIVFDAAIPAITLADIEYATWLLPTRFFSDRLQLDWMTNVSAVATVNFLTLRDES